MSKEDDAIIQAVTDRLMKAPFMGGNAFHCRLAAKAVIEAYLDGLEKAGWKVVPVQLNEEMTEAGADNNHGGRYTFVPAYEAALSASPTPPGAG